MSSMKEPLHRTLETMRVVIPDGKKQLRPRLNKWNQVLIKAEMRHASGANLYDEQCQAEQLYMDDMKKPFTYHGCWEICKGLVIFQDPP
ncbi:hypothetical protein D8674_024643 [Pyrus ussuriensis x Pyrus communis]|uniref:Uncharacterized protein n=1 Tax=Pyrus ussuriensis x Pyrus communis TaxID=2448454 RepID=A0A5N5H8H7_9ROSA|nr:hypothetical protein D8674_024643 [Pyrus ussuriensis x Pyrus communis]